MDPVEEAWEKLQENWGNDDAHRRFIALCQSFGRLPEAGQRYRAVRDGDPSEEKRAQATQHIDKLFAAAVSTMEAHRSPPPKRNPILLWVGFAITLLMILTATWAVIGSSPPTP